MKKICFLLFLLVTASTSNASCGSDDYFSLQNRLYGKLDKLEEVTYFYSESEKISGEVNAQRITRDLFAISYQTPRIKGGILIGFEALEKKVYIANFMEGARFQSKFVENDNVDWCKSKVTFSSGELILELEFQDMLKIVLINSSGDQLGRWIFR